MAHAFQSNSGLTDLRLRLLRLLNRRVTKKSVRYWSKVLDDESKAQLHSVLLAKLKKTPYNHQPPPYVSALRKRELETLAEAVLGPEQRLPTKGELAFAAFKANVKDRAEMDYVTFLEQHYDETLAKFSEQITEAKYDAFIAAGREIFDGLAELVRCFSPESAKFYADLGCYLRQIELKELPTWQVERLKRCKGDRSDTKVVRDIKFAAGCAYRDLMSCRQQGGERLVSSNEAHEIISERLRRTGHFVPTQKTLRDDWANLSGVRNRASSLQMPHFQDLTRVEIAQKLADSWITNAEIAFERTMARDTGKAS